MILLMEIVLIIFLAAILIFLYKDELFRTKSAMPKAKIEEYWNGKNRRRYVRFKKKLSADYVLKKRRDLKNNCTTIDISEGGMKLLIAEKLSEGTILSLQLPIPNSSLMAEIEAVVVWSKDLPDKDEAGRRLFNAGVKFHAVREPAGSDFINYIRSLGPELRVE